MSVAFRGGGKWMGSRRGFSIEKKRAGEGEFFCFHKVVQNPKIMYGKRSEYFFVYVYVSSLLFIFA